MANKSRVKRIFGEVLSHAKKRSALGNVKVEFCSMANADHDLKWRQFAHTGHKPGVVCFAEDAEEELTDGEIRGISAHELGHVLADKMALPAHTQMSKESRVREKTPKKVQEEADGIARWIFGLPLYYNSRSLEELSERFVG